VRHPRRGFHGRLGACIGAALFAVATLAHADARTEARSHFKKGMEAIANGHYEDGIAELKRANEILPHPSVVYNIARAYAESGDLENAVAYYNRYLEGDPSDRDEVGQIVTNLEARIRRQQAAAQQASQAAVAPTPPEGGAPGPVIPPPTAPVSPALPSPVRPASPSTNIGKARTDDVFEETVVTASKGAQSPLDAPSSTSIVTEQDIRLSGITKIPELLRRLAGVDIMEVTGAQTEVSIRGFNQRLSNKVLVLVDGRSFYLDSLGATLWSALTIGVEDIERIEVVRGPGSALYGADAFNGVINIITKAPGSGPSGINAGFGDHDQTHGSVWVTGRDKDLAWRASAGYDYLPRWSREVPDGRQDLALGSTDQNMSSRTTRFDLRGTEQLGKNVTLGLGGGLAQGDSEILGIGPLNDVDLTGFQATDITAFLNSPSFETRVFWKTFRTPFSLNEATLGQSLLPGEIAENVVDAEAQYIGKFETGKGIDHDLHIGLNYRFKEVDWSYLVGQQQENHGGFLAHDAVKLGKIFGLVGDIRVDYDPYLERFIPSPRGSVLVHPSKKSTVRGTVATAFRAPTFLESYLDLPTQLPAAGANLAAQEEKVYNPTFKVQPEQIFTTELGYLNQDSDYLVVDTAVYFNHARDLIELAPLTPVSVSNIEQGLTSIVPGAGTYPIFLGGFDNQCQSYNVYGGELGVRVFPVEGLDVYANTTLNKVQQDNSNCTVQQLALFTANGQPVVDQRSSLIKVNTGVQLRTKFGFDGSVDFHYVSPQTWAEQVTNVQQQIIQYQAFPLSAYTLLNARLGFRFLSRDRAELSVVGFNLLGIEHREHPFGQLLGRRVMGYFTYRF
jgi:outer membrane receptor protein involved in Fe transport